MIRATHTPRVRHLLLVLVILFLGAGLAVAVSATGTTSQQATAAPTQVTHSLTVTFADVPADGTARTATVTVPDVLAGTLSVSETRANGDGLAVSNARIVDGPDNDGVEETIAVDVVATGERAVTGSVDLTVVGSYPELSEEEAAAMEIGSADGTVQYTVNEDSRLVAAYVERSDASLSDIAIARSILGVTPPSGAVVVDLQATVTREDGVSLTVPLRRIGGTPSADVDPASMTFEEPGEQTVRVENTGDIPLALDAPRFAQNGSVFEARMAAETLAAGAETTISVAYNGSAGETATLILGTNATADQIVELAGPPEAPQPSIEVRPTTLTFEGTSEQEVAITNTGNVPLTLAGPTLSGTTAGFETELGVETLAPGATTTVLVSYDSTAGYDGSIEELGVLAVGTNATDEWTVTLRGPAPLEDESDDEDDSDGESEARPERRMQMETVEQDENQTTMRATVRNASAGEQVTMEVDDDPERDVAVENISVIPALDGDFTFNMTTSSSPPSSMPEMNTTAKQPLGFMSIDHSIDNENIENASLTVRVKKSKIEAMATTDPDDVALYRHTDGQWAEQDTRLVGESETHLTYRVFTDGFSDWATAGKQASFRIVQTNVNVTSVTVDDAINVAVRIQNDGAADGEYETELILNDVVVEDRQIAIAADGTGQVNFERRLQQSGTYQVQVNKVIVDEIEVQAPADQSQDGSESSGGGLPVTVIAGGIVALLIVLGAGFFVLRGRQN